MPNELPSLNKDFYLMITKPNNSVQHEIYSDEQLLPLFCLKAWRNFTFVPIVWFVELGKFQNFMLPFRYILHKASQCHSTNLINYIRY